MKISRPVLSKEEQDIRSSLQQLSDQVQNTLDNICTAISELDTDLCKRIINDDKKINALHTQIAQECLNAIATQQPVARDLRVLMAATHINVELERIADHIAGIAKTIIKMANENASIETGTIVAMAIKCKSILKQSFQAYLEQDSNLAVQVSELDLEIDDQQSRISNEIITSMCNNSAVIPFGTYLLWIVHGLERIGDRATNICEQVFYMEKGEIPDLNQ